MSILTSVLSAFFILFNLAYNVLIYPGPDKLINYTNIKMETRLLIHILQQMFLSIVAIIHDGSRL